LNTFEFLVLISYNNVNAISLGNDSNQKQPYIIYSFEEERSRSGQDTMSHLPNKQLPSQLIRDAISNTDHPLKVEDIISALGSQSFGLIFIVMALPLIIPLPPGVGFLPAALLLIWAIQRALGGTILWLPKAIGKRELSQGFINKIENKALPMCERLEKIFLNSRPGKLSETEIRLASIVVAFQSIFIMLPTPFLNSLWALITLLMGLTILNQNRAFLWLNMSVGLLAVFAIGSTIYAGSEALLEELFDML